MKKLVAMLLTLAMVLGLCCPALAAEEPDPMPEDWWMDEVPSTQPEPTLTLTVNGADRDAVVTAENGVTYADAAALRDILGEKAVPAGKTGLLPIREAAQAAGWDVQWYDGGWRGLDQEVQLWDRAAYEAALDEEFGPLNEFLAKALKAGGGALFSGAPVTSRRTVNAQWTAFSTLDGDRTFSVDLAADVTVGGGVMDATVTFDASALLGLLPENTLDALLRRADAGFTAAQLRQFLKAGVAEFIIDCNAGEAAWNIPLLGLLDESLAGWQTEYLSGLEELSALRTGEEEFSLMSTLYAQMLTTASYSGAEYAAEDYENTVAVLKLFGGKARFSADGRGKTTYALTTDAVNEAMGELLARAGMDAPGFSAFKAFDVTYTLDDKGSVTAKAHIRPDVEGILAGLLSSEDGYYSAAGLLGLSMAGRDMELTAAMEGNTERSTATFELHQNNVGKLTVRSAAEAKTGSKPPRTVEDVVK